jgi:hypothetical protein
MTISATLETTLKEDLATRLYVSASEIATELVETRTWPDAGLGCRAQRGVLPAQPIQGYLVVLQHGDARYTYHTDQGENFVFCPEVNKPLDRIQ